MVVDDEPAVLELERVILEPAGYRVLRMHDGASAVALLETEAPLDLSIADLRMPTMGGAEMVRRIRRTRPDLKVLYVTGYIDRLFDARPLWEGEAFLEKPFSIESLREAVSVLLYGTTTKPLTR